MRSCDERVDGEQRRTVPATGVHDERGGGPVPVAEDRPAPFSAAVEREVCDLVLGDRRHGI